MRWWPPGWAVSACVFGLAAYAAGLIITLPAGLVDAGLERATRGIVRLAESRGTVWSGAGQLEIRDKNQRIGNAHRLTWRLRPWLLLRGQFAFAVALDQASPQISLTIGLAGIEVSNVDIALPAAVLGLVEPRLAPLKLDGALSLHIPRLVIGRQLIQGNGVLRWQRASSALTTVSPLGSYELDFAGSGATVHTTMRTLQGPLQIDGKGSWDTSNASAFTGSVRVPASLQQELTPLLRLLAIERSAGNFEIQLR